MKTYFRMYSMLVLLLLGSASMMAQDVDPFGDVNNYRWYGSMTMTVEVQQNGVVITDAVVAAFIDGELHGKERVGAGTRPHLAYLMIHGDYLDKYQYIQFKVYANGHVFTFDPTPAIDFEDYWNNNIGTTADPFIIPIPTPLDDKGDNSDVLNTWAGQTIDVILYGRTLYLDGDWNTICLPFDQSVSEMKGAEARTITAASIDGTTLHLTFGAPVETLEAGTPYIIKFAKNDDYVADGTHDYLNPVFYGVTISTAKNDFDNGQSGNLRVRFLGTYASRSFTADDKSILMMGTDNTLYYPLANASIGACRAYFKIGEDGAAAPAGIRAFVLNFGDETTGIVSIEHGTLTIEHSADAWYTLDGRRLVGKPSRAGVYIYNDVKRVIK